MPLAASDPDDRVRQLTILTERLTGLMLQETEHLKARRIEEAGKIVEEKATLVKVYDSEMRVVSGNRALVTAARADALARLREKTAAFQAAAAEQTRLLTTLRAVTEGMVKAVADGVQRKRQTSSAYGQTGGYQPLRGGTPLAMNEVV